MKRILTQMVLLAAFMVMTAQPGRCDSSEMGWKDVGIRGGFMATGRDANFHEYQVHTTYGLPWALRSASGWGAAMQVNGALGVLHAEDDNGMIASLGPEVIFDKNGKGFGLFLGGDLNGVTRDHYGSESNHHSVDLNGNLLFDGHAGVKYRFPSGIGLDYVFQHISNAGLNGRRNTGVDFHLFGVSWNF